MSRRFPGTFPSVGVPVSRVLLPLCAALVFGLTRLHAQDAPATPAPASSELFVALDDIDGLRALQPLKLTTAQLDKVIQIVTDAQEETRKRQEAANQIVRALADDIRAVRQSALRGEPIPKEFDVKVKKAETEFVKKREDIRQQAILTLSTALQKALTPEQITNAAHQDKEARVKLGKNSGEGSDAQWFNSYVVDAFIDVPRVLPLLKEMRTARQAEGAATQ